MDSTMITAVSAVFGSCVGGAASITTTWLARHRQTRASKRKPGSAIASRCTATSLRRPPAWQSTPSATR